ncbi:unnamed protein product [Closterium sp. Yama58-4]|nr:unnamed protein product [Closterium sp. Yama58-4]
MGGRRAECYEGGESSRDDMGVWGARGYGSSSGASAGNGDYHMGGRDEAGGGAMEEAEFAGVMKKKLGRRASQPPTIFGSALAAAAAVDGSSGLEGFRGRQGGLIPSENFRLGQSGFGRLHPGSEGEVMKVLGDVDMLIERCMEMLIADARSGSPLPRSVSAGDGAPGSEAAAAAASAAAAAAAGAGAGGDGGDGGISLGHHSISNSRYSKSLSAIDDSSGSGGGASSSRTVNPMYSAQYSALVKRFKKLSSRPPITLDPFGRLAAAAAAAEVNAFAEDAAFADETGEVSGGNGERVGEGGRGGRGGGGGTGGAASSRTGSKGKDAGSRMEGDMTEEEGSVHKRTMSDDLFARDPLHAAFGVCHQSPHVSPNSSPSACAAAVAAGRDGTAGGEAGRAGKGPAHRFHAPHVEIPTNPELVSPKQTHPHPLFAELEAVEVEDTFAAETHARIGANASGIHGACAQNEAATNGDEDEDGGGPSNFTFSPLSDTSGSGSSASISRSTRAAAEDIPNLLPSPVQMSGPASIVSAVSAIHARKNRSSQLARSESDAAGGARRLSRREREQQKKQQERDRQQVQEEEDLYPLPDLPIAAHSFVPFLSAIPRSLHLQLWTIYSLPLPSRMCLTYLPPATHPLLYTIYLTSTLRAGALEAAIAALEMGEVRAPALSSLPWSSQEAFLKAWVRDAYLLVSVMVTLSCRLVWLLTLNLAHSLPSHTPYKQMDVLLVAERFLCDSVFLFSHNLSTRSFRRIVPRAAALKQALHLLCGNAAAICSSDEQPEKLFSLLDMIQTTQDLGSQNILTLLLYLPLSPSVNSNGKLACDSSFCITKVPQKQSLLPCLTLPSPLTHSPMQMEDVLMAAGMEKAHEQWKKLPKLLTSAAIASIDKLKERLNDVGAAQQQAMAVAASPRSAQKIFRLWKAPAEERPREETDVSVHAITSYTVNYVNQLLRKDGSKYARMLESVYRRRGGETGTRRVLNEEISDLLAALHRNMEVRAEVIAERTVAALFMLNNTAYVSNSL